MAAGLKGSEILKIAGDIRAQIAAGAKICNLTVGDFDSKQFPIPEFLRDAVIDAIRAGETNYPPSDGVMPLRQSLQCFLKSELGLDYPIEGILVTGGARPAIYGTYRSLLDPGDVVVYPIPSWNNNHYCHQLGVQERAVVCSVENAFLPTRAQLQKAIRGARLLSLNSPLNPTGTAFTAEVLGEICDMVLEENRRRGKRERPLYVMYDQVYWMLTFGGVKHVTPVGLRPAMRDYTVFVDGLSKPFSATGLRVGWCVGPSDVIAAMSNILGHVGAWAPRAEQIATAKLLDRADVIRDFHAVSKQAEQARLDALFQGLTALKAAGLPVDALAPAGAIYLTARFALMGRKTPAGTKLTTNEEIRRYLLDAAGCGIVPFQAFGAKTDDGWFRMSIGAVSLADIAAMFPRVEAALQALQQTKAP
ncbi:MAG: aminotransferase class I/II-fold pyridoxal phosphate-dependent enzyme [Planctomycetes bacterium]|nr:aminotransferase class I/II-fold pyridoxal phosphate-dependent enzyme [Planctomycetota bacterium]